jgi:hypothetical protein
VALFSNARLAINAFAADDRPVMLTVEYSRKTLKIKKAGTECAGLLQIGFP